MAEEKKDEEKENKDLEESDSVQSDSESEENNSEENKPDKDKKEKKGVTLKVWQIILIIILIILLLFSGTCVGLSWHTWFGDGGFPTGTSQVESTPSRNPGDPDIDPNAAHWDGKLPDDGQSKQSDSIKIPGYPSVKVAANTTDVQMFLLNPEGNPCYFSFEVVLKDTGETLYQSKLVPPGQAIINVKLSRPLEKGTYKAVVKISTASLENQTPMNGANMETEIIAE